MKKKPKFKHFNNKESEFQTIDPFKKGGEAKKTYINGPRYTIEFVDSIVNVSEKNIEELKRKYPKAKFIKWDNHYKANKEIYIKRRDRRNDKISKEQMDQTDFTRLKEIQEFRGHNTFFYALDSQKGDKMALGIVMERDNEFPIRELVKVISSRDARYGGHYAIAAAVLKAKSMGLTKFVIFTDSVEAMNDVYIINTKSETSRRYRDWFNKMTEGMEVELCKIKGRRTIRGNELAAERVSNYMKKDADTTYTLKELF